MDEQEISKLSQESECESEDRAESEISEEETQEDQIDIGNVMNFFLTDQKGTVLADILTGIKTSIDTQNNILMKLGSVIQKHGK
jgi:hypothetical protein